MLVPIAFAGNSLDDCYPQEVSPVQQGFSFLNWSWVLLLSICLICWVFHILLFFYGKYNDNIPSSLLDSQASELIDRDDQYALDTIGRDSVYRFFLGTTLRGWSIALITLAAQFFMLLIFVIASEFDLSNSNNDLVFTWKVRIHFSSSTHRSSCTHIICVCSYI